MSSYRHNATHHFFKRKVVLRNLLVVGFALAVYCLINLAFSNFLTVHAQGTGLVGSWSFDEGTGISASDSSGNQNTGTLVNGTTWVTGHSGTAANFNGGTNAINLPTSLSLSQANGMTLSAWIRPTRVDVSQLVIGKFGGSETTNLYGIGVEGGKGIRFFIKTATNKYAEIVSIPLTPNTWYYVTGIYNGSSLSVYVNGNLVGTPLVASGLVTDVNTSNSRIGLSSNNILGFSGAIDDVRVYNRALTQLEVQNDMATPVVIPSPTNTTPPVISNGQPTGTLLYTATQTTLSIATNVNATCAYSSLSGQIFGSMTPFTTTGTTTHSATINVSSGQNYTYYSKCKDASGNIDSNDYTVSFNVASAPLPDTIAPTVTVTNPSVGSTATGPVSITASATDNVGVVGVQFQIDGVNVGAESTVAPYSTVWNTTLTNNGTHTLSAVARDAAGNKGTSTPVSVSVYNQKVSNLQYCTSSSVDQMDLYYPAQSFTAPLPVVLFIHGGGWSSGDKLSVSGASEYGQELTELNLRGYLVASINYRMAPTYVFPSFQEDAKCAVRFLRANASYYNLNPNRIGAWGFSAGGQMVSMLGVTPSGTMEGTGNNLNQSSSVQAVVIYSGPEDLTVVSDWPVGGQGYTSITSAFGASPGSGNPVLVTASPAYHAAAGDPPYAIFSGLTDTLVYPDQAQRMSDALTAVGVPIQLTFIQNCGHNFNQCTSSSPTRTQIVQSMASFLDQYLK